jgi:hypothetical protein
VQARIKKKSTGERLPLADQIAVAGGVSALLWTVIGFFINNYEQF